MDRGKLLKIVENIQPTAYNVDLCVGYGKYLKLLKLCSNYSKTSLIILLNVYDKVWGYVLV